MANQTIINIRTDAEVKSAAEKLFQNLGLNMSVAVNVFLRQAIIQGGLPFDVKLDVPNETTAAAIEEGRKLIKNKKTKGYKDIKDLRKALDV